MPVVSCGTHRDPARRCHPLWRPTKGLQGVPEKQLDITKNKCWRPVHASSLRALGSHRNPWTRVRLGLITRVACDAPQRAAHAWSSMLPGPSAGGQFRLQSCLLIGPVPLPVFVATGCSMPAALTSYQLSRHLSTPPEAHALAPPTLPLSSPTPHCCRQPPFWPALLPPCALLRVVGPTTLNREFAVAERGAVVRLSLLLLHLVLHVPGQSPVHRPDSRLLLPCYCLSLCFKLPHPPAF